VKQQTPKLHLSVSWAAQLHDPPVTPVNTVSSVVDWGVRSQLPCHMPCYMPCRHTADADVAVMEGVMGLYDSRDGSSDDGSTAQVCTSCWHCQRPAPTDPVPVPVYQP
jgi:hypothetical protein